MAGNAYEYYTNSENHGNYQFAKLCEVLDSLLLESKSDDDSYIKGVDKFLLQKYAYDGLRDMAFSGMGDCHGLELSIGDDLQFILPQNYVDYIRISVVGTDCRLHVLDQNRNMQLATTYLQDHEYNVIFDSDCNPIEADGSNVAGKGYKIYEFGLSYEETLRADFNGRNVSTNIDTSKLSRYGEFNIDKKRGVIFFSSNLQGKEVVLEYISDGLESLNIDDDTITFPKYYQQPLEDYIYYRAIARKRNVPQSEIERARKRYKTTKHKASILLLNLDPQKIMRVMRTASKPIKT